jgi:hypothetical protein
MTFVELYQDYREAGTAGLLRLRTDGALSSAAMAAVAGPSTVNLFDPTRSWSRVAATITDGRRAVSTRLGGAVAMSAAAAACLGGIFAVGGVAAQLAVGPNIHAPAHHHQSGNTGGNSTANAGGNTGSAPAAQVSNTGPASAVLTSVVKTPAGSQPITISKTGSPPPVITPPPSTGPTGPISTPTGVGAVVDDLATTVAVTVSGLTHTVGTTATGLVNTLGGTLTGGVGTVGALLHLV